MHANNHRITQKAKGAIELFAKLYSTDVGNVRTDRAAVKQMYLDLEQNNYRWVGAKQEWAYVGEGTPPLENQYAQLIVGAIGVSLEDAAYIMAEGLKAAGYKVGNVEIVFPLDGDPIPMLHMDIQL